MGGTNMRRLPGALLVDSAVNTNGTQTAFAGDFAASAAGERNYVTGVWAKNTSATPITFAIHDGAAGAALKTFTLPATTERWIPLDGPIRQPTANAALGFKTSAGVTSFFIEVHGYKAA